MFKLLLWKIEYLMQTLQKLISAILTLCSAAMPLVDDVMGEVGTRERIDVMGEVGTRERIDVMGK